MARGTLRSPMGRVLGSGSARSGTGHWWMQRVTAVGLVLLGAWFLVSLLLLPGASFETLREWLARPWNAVLMILLASTMAWHSSLGVQVVIEDYVHQPFVRVASLILSRFLHVLLAAGAVFAVLDIAYGAA